MYVCNVYRAVLREGGTKLAIRTAFAVIIAAGMVASLVYIFKPLESNALYWRGVLPVATAMFLVWAVTWRKILATWIQNRTPARWLVLGYGPLVRCLWRDARKGGLKHLCFLKQLVDRHLVAVDAARLRNRNRWLAREVSRPSGATYTRRSNLTGRIQQLKARGFDWRAMQGGSKQF
jgi:hypothetical protein